MKVKGLIAVAVSVALGWPVLLVAPLTVAAESGGAVAGQARSNAASIVSGDSHTCAIVADGRVVCWGDDSLGQLGNGPGVGSVDAPGDPIVLPTGTHAIALTAGAAHTCALLNDGSVSCWGDDSDGQLGNGAVTGSVDAPGPAIGLASAASAVAAGSKHTCALLINGDVSCWGDDSSGQVGNGSTLGDVMAPSPALTVPGSAIAIAAGDAHTCVVMASAEISCWGSDVSGQIGNGASTTADVTSPSPALTLPVTSGAKAIALGANHSCAVLMTSELSCWGSDVSGQLGNGSTTGNVAVPQKIGLPGGVKADAVAAGGSHTCALTNQDKVFCWGDDASGQLGNGAAGSTNAAVSPVVMPGGAATLAVAAGLNHTCALLSMYQIACWGSDAGGSLVTAPRLATRSCLRRPSSPCPARRLAFRFPWPGVIRVRCWRMGQ